MSFSFDDLLDEATSRIGGEDVSGYEARAGRRAFKIMLSDWSNRGATLWTMEEITRTNVIAAQITLPADTVDVAEIFVRTGGDDHTLTRIGRGVYAGIQDKARTGEPTQFFLDRQKTAPILNLHPVPEGAEVHIWRIRAYADAVSMGDGIDLPLRFYEPASAGLAFFMMSKRIAADKNATEVQLALLDRMKDAYERAIAAALEADRDTGNVRFEVDFGGYFS